MNYQLYSFFYDTYKVLTLGVNLPNGKDIKFLINNEKNNTPESPPNYYEMKQMSPTLYQWYDLQGIIFTTNMNIRHETVVGKNSGGNNIELPILTDFIVDFSKNDRSQFVYNANPYRWIDCVGHGAIKKFDYTINIIDKYNNQKPFYLPPNNYLSCKFVFEKKCIRNNFI